MIGSGRMGEQHGHRYASEQTSPVKLNACCCQAVVLPTAKRHRITAPVSRRATGPAVGLRRVPQDLYDHCGRWVIAAAVLAGRTLGAVTAIPELYVSFLFAFPVGAVVVLNVLKEEFPKEFKGRLGPFALAAAGYAALLLRAG